MRVRPHEDLQNGRAELPASQYGMRSPPLKGQFCAGCGGFSDY
jgi:hypothetical protein